MLHRCNKAILYVSAVTLVMVILIITKVTAYCANDIPTGDSFTSVTGSDYYVSAQNVKAGAGEDFEVVVTTSGDQYRETQIWQTEMYFTYNFKVLSGAYNQYCTGDLLISDTVSCSFTVGQSWTSDNYRYSISIVDQSGDFNVSMYNNGNGYQFNISFVDLYTNSNEGYSFTCVCKAQGRSYVNAQVSYVQAYAPTVTLNHSLAISGTSGFVASGDSKLHDQVVSAISDTTEIQGILANLGYIHIDLGLIDSKIASFMAQEASYDASLVTQLNNLLTGTYEINDPNTGPVTMTGGVGTLLSKLLQVFNSTNANVTASNSEINQVQSSEQGAMNQVNNLVSSLNTSTDMDYDEAVQVMHIGTNNVFNNMAVPIRFWRNVSNWILDIDNLGYLSWALLMLLVISFTVWVLAL